MLISFCGFSIAYTFPEPKRHDTIKGSELVYTADQVEDIATNISAKAEITTNRYPMFVIELNSDIMMLDSNNNIIYDYSDYLSFELKATTNNFFHEGIAWTNTVDNIERVIPGLPEPKSTLFWASCYDVLNRNPSYNECMRTFACDASANPNNANPTTTTPGDNRSLYRFENAFDNQWYSNKLHTNRFTTPKYVVVIIDYKALVEKVGEKDAEWLHDKNDFITWHLIRFTLKSMERGWSPCYPIKWFNEMPSWACMPDEKR